MLVQKRGFNQIDWASAIASGGAGALASWGGFRVGPMVDSRLHWSYALGRFGIINPKSIAETVSSGVFGIGTDALSQRLLTTASSCGPADPSLPYNRMQPYR